ncbi:Aste57867_10465 [Aphanomyces stellatus]|uniref:Aste57867_10465 protein n=1 Tax=Aphanomyces stellatus TaxID=120398 RepID=A0A485KRI4_9STRA|nr:hypothetical protein As57867_010425 [Aphanomyces stellatus]VFT87339.1 Aste57867_10465 [Aphanomyces stellatus]
MHKSDIKQPYAALATPTSSCTQDEPNPMGSSNWLAVGLMFWLDPLIHKGAKATLVESDVWRLAPADSAASLQARFATFWARELTETKPLFVRALVRTLWRDTVVATSIFVSYAIVMLVQPTVIQSLLQFLLGKPTTALGISSGYALAAILTALSFVSVTLVDFAQAIVAKAGCNAKTLSMDAVFSKALTLSTTSKRAFSSGHIVTLATVDATRIFDLYIWGPWVLVAPLMLLAIFVILGFHLGVVVGVVGGVLMAIVMLYSFKAAKTVGRLRHELSAVQSERVKLTNEVLQGVRVVKLYAWESLVQARLDAIRAREVDLLRRFQFNSRLPAATLQVSSVVVFAAALLVYVAQGHALTPDIAFAAIAYVGVARLPCSLFCNGVINCSESLASCDRLSAFLQVDDQVHLLTHVADASAPAVVSLDRASFAWTPDATPTLRHITLSLAPRTLTIVVGAVGSGKSSLVSALLGEMHRCVDEPGHVHVSGDIAYVSQEPWIQHASLRENVVFYDELDEYRYDQVLSACQLQPDLARLPNGDATEIGERGINLSGGQKARVGLARAMYRAAHASLYLLDDPLSALDVHVAGAVFRDCVQKLLADKTVVLVLNSHYHLLPFADRVVVMEDGAIVGDGPFASIQTSFPHLVSVHAAVAAIDEEEATIETTTPDDNANATTPTSTKAKVQLVAAEASASGAVSASTYVTYFSSSGWNGTVAAAALVAVFGGSQALLVVADWYLGHWARTASASVDHAYFYFGLAVVAVGCVYATCVFALTFCLGCSKQLHATLLAKVLHAPVTTFFDVTPVGRVLNRFASDLDQLDNLFPWLGILQAQSTFQVLAVLLVCGITSPYVVLLYLPLVFVFRKVQRYFDLSSAQLKRLDSTTKSPLVNLISEILSGLSTIRAFAMTPTFQARARAALDHNQTYYTIHFMASRWLQMRLDWLSAVIITGVSFLVVASKDSIGVTAAGLALTYASQLSSLLSRAVQGHSKLESIMTCAERLHEYNQLAGEDTHDPTTVTTTPSSADWPTHGAVAFNGYSMRYRPELELVLDDVSFAVRGGERVGICGRTGSGKSSLLAALFRTVDGEGGSITIDGVDIATVDLHVLRSRLTIIPQDPVLFSGSLRFNLDPADAFTDMELWTVLKQVHLADVVASLDFEVAEKGSNLSVGQRQLLCIGRALLRQSRVVVLDEATASIDLETDRLIQQTIRDNFGGVTMLVIAHRLDTITDSDRILVMDQGRVKEFDTPAALLATEASTFAALMKQAHLVLADDE